ncbi:MAG: site-specific integrase [bacterium]
MAGVRKKALRSGKYQGWFVDYSGKRKFFVGTHIRSETGRMADRLEDEHRQICLGYRPVPNPSNKHATRPFAEVVEEYLLWGCAQGGRRGRPWSKTHARKRRAELARWGDCLELETLGDLKNILPRVEGMLREILAAGRTGKTAANFVESLKGFCNWCVDREYLLEDPLKRLGSVDTTPQTRRRAMTPDEIRQLLDHVPEYRRLLYEIALVTGLRANELRNLTVQHLDTERGGLHLDAAWTKNRRSGFQPLSRRLIERLRVHVEAGVAGELYRKHYNRRDTKRPIDGEPLLYVPSNPSRTMEEDLKSVGIPKWTPEGKIDFHACRVAYITFLLSAGASVKEAMALARHSTPDLTLNVYGRTEETRLSELVEKVADTAFSGEICAHSVHTEATGTDGEGTNLLHIKQLRENQPTAGGGTRTPTS